jgi:hypothetical protein
MSNNILEHLGEILKNNPQNLTIVEDQIDIEIQMEYFKISRVHKESKTDIVDVSELEKLSNPDLSIEEKKQLLSRLATLENVEAYRAIEAFYNAETDPFLQSWSALALKESRMMLESSLLEEKQILISTGLGGKKSKLRYFIVFVSKSGESFNDTQKKVIKSEVEFLLQENRSDVESIEFDENYSKIISLIPLDVPIKDTISNVIDECNQYGDFIKHNFIITNVKKLSTQEITDFLNAPDNEDEDEETDFDELDINDLLE